MQSNAETTFFSYSRTDGEFVKQLAKDLRHAGARVWLDQLDIKPGAHWDSAIEKALNESKHLLVVLSPSSVNSNNVMDEVSFALENGKTVIPVLINNCTIPFRLRRLQYIDFTNDYQQGLSQLVNVLGRQTAQSPDYQNDQANTEAKKAAVQNTEATGQGSSGAMGTGENSSSKSSIEDAANSGQQWQEKTENAALKSRTPAGTNNKKQKLKYMLIGGATAVCILIVVIFILPPSDNTTATDLQTKGMSDSTVPEENNGAEPLTIGSQHEGGYVFSLNESGKSGLIAAPEDIPDNKFQNAVHTSEYEEAFTNLKKACELNKPDDADWQLPTIDELKQLYANRNVIPNLDSTSGCSEKPYASFYYSATRNEKGEVRGMCFTDETEQWTFIDGGKVRLVRKF